jgi:hypothetical protein
MSYQKTVKEILEKYGSGTSDLATQVKILHEDSVTITLQFKINGDTHVIKAIRENDEWTVHEQR